MRKILSLLLALALLLSLAATVTAEEDEFGDYLSEHPEAKVFDSVWITEDADWRAEVYAEDGGFKIMVVHNLGEQVCDVWEYGALYEEADKTLTCSPFGMHYKEDPDPSKSWEYYYEDGGDAVFSINENGKLVWKDLIDNAGEGLEFLKIGNFYGTEWLKDGNVEIDFWEWYEGEYDIRLIKVNENGEQIDDAILKGTYDAASNIVNAWGSWNDGEVFYVVFSYNEVNDLVWTENEVSTVCEYNSEIN